MATNRDLLSEALALPLAERAKLAHDLLVSLDEGEDAGADEAWTAEIGRRLKEIDDGTAVLEDWDAVRSRIASRLRTMRK